MKATVQGIQSVDFNTAVRWQIVAALVVTLTVYKVVKFMFWTWNEYNTVCQPYFNKKKKFKNCLVDVNRYSVF